MLKFSKQLKNKIIKLDGVVLYIPSDSTILHIRKGSGSYLTKDDKKNGYCDYAKITHYVIEDDQLLFIETIVLLLKTSYYEMMTDSYLKKIIIQNILKRLYTSAETEPYSLRYYDIHDSFWQSESSTSRGSKFLELTESLVG